MGPPPSKSSIASPFLSAATKRSAANYDKRNTLMNEILTNYLSGEPVLGSKMLKVNLDLHGTQHFQEWSSVRKMLQLYERIPIESPSADIVGPFGRQLEVLWSFCPTLTKAMQQKDDCLKDIVYVGLANVQQQLPQRLTLSEIVKRIVMAMPQRNKGLIDCMNLAVDMAPTTPTTSTWEKLMFRTFRFSDNPSSCSEDGKVILRGLQKLDACSWPQTESELIEAVEFVMSKTQNRFTPIKVLQEMMFACQKPHVTPVLLVCSSSQILRRIQATLLVLKFIEPLDFFRWKQGRGRGPEASISRDRTSPHKRMGSDSTRIDSKKKHISPRKLKSLEIETKLAEIASRRAVADRSAGVGKSIVVDGKGVPRKKVIDATADAKMPQKSDMAKLPSEDMAKLPSKVPVSSVVVAQTQKDYTTTLSNTTTQSNTTTLSNTTTQSNTTTPANTTSPSNTTTLPTLPLLSTPLEALEIARKERDAEIEELLDNVSSNEPINGPLEDPKQTLVMNTPLTSAEKLLQIKQEIADLARARSRMSAADAKAKIAHLQPGVQQFLGSIQGHDPHVANAFLVGLIMSGQVDVYTTLEQVQRKKLRYPRHTSFFLPKDDKLLLQLMRGAQAESSKLNRLFKRHLASDIELRTKFLAYLIARRESA